MKGIFELRPPNPKITTNWSVGRIVVFVQEMGPVERLSLQDLSLKLAVLLALTSATQVHELIALNRVNVIIMFIHRTLDKISIDVRSCKLWPTNGIDTRGS